MGPLVMASQLATGLGVLAGAVLVKSATDGDKWWGPAGGGHGGAWRSRRCSACNGTGRVACLCSRWSDGDAGCRTCAGSGRMACRSCSGSGTGRTAPVSVAVKPKRSAY